MDCLYSPSRREEVFSETGSFRQRLSKGLLYGVQYSPTHEENLSN